jgi:hypothetical protein
MQYAKQEIKHRSIRIWTRSRHGRDSMVVGFATTYAISAYRHWCCEFESRSGRGVQHYVIKFVSELRQVGGFLPVLRFPLPIKLTARYSWNIVESAVKHHQTNKQSNESESKFSYIFWNICRVNLSNLINCLSFDLRLLIISLYLHVFSEHRSIPKTSWPNLVQLR